MTNAIPFKNLSIVANFETSSRMAGVPLHDGLIEEATPAPVAVKTEEPAPVRASFAALTMDSVGQGMSLRLPHGMN